MNWPIALVAWFMALLLIHRLYQSAHKRGFLAGMKLGLAVFKGKLPLETYKSICQARVEELDALKRVKP